MREQLEQRIEATWPRPFLLRPPALLFFVTVDSNHGKRCQRACYGELTQGCWVSAWWLSRAAAPPVLKPSSSQGPPLMSLDRRKCSID